MKQRVATALSCLLFLVMLMATGVVTSFTHRIEPTMQVDAAVGTELPVLMYHHLLKDEARVGDYVITPAMFEKDLIELKNRGYTPVRIQELLDYAVGRGGLPPKPILITFDDGYETFYEYAFSILQQYQTPAVVSVIGKYSDLYTDKPDHHLSYSHLTWDEVDEMYDSGLVEIGNHTYGLHQNDGGRKGILKLKSESASDYETMLKEDLDSVNRAIEEVTGRTARVFAYPFGAYTDESAHLVESMGFSVLLTCEEKVNFLQEGQGLPLVLDRYNRAGKYSSKEFFDKIEK